MRRYLFVNMLFMALAVHFFAPLNAAKPTTRKVFDSSQSSSGSECSESKTCTDFQKTFPVRVKLSHTSNELDLAICGEGYFRIMLPDGTDAYTRYGRFHINNANLIVTPDGYTLLGTLLDPITIPPGSTDITVTESGKVYALNNGVRILCGQILLAKFVHPECLQNIGNYLYQETTCSGTAIIGTAGQNGYGSIIQGCLEKSNVNSQSRIYTSTSNTVITDPGVPSLYMGNELNQLNNDGNLGDGHNVYANVGLCQAYPTTLFIGAGFGGSGSPDPVYNYGQILIRNRVPNVDCSDVTALSVEAYLGMAGYIGTYPADGVLVILVWNATTSTWEMRYVNTLFPIQGIQAIDYPVSLEKVKLTITDVCNYIDADGFINFFIYTPFSGTSDNPQNPAQIDMGCFTMCVYECT